MCCKNGIKIISYNRVGKTHEEIQTIIFRVQFGAYRQAASTVRRVTSLCGRKTSGALSVSKSNKGRLCDNDVESRGDYQMYLKVTKVDFATTMLNRVASKKCI